MKKMIVLILFLFMFGVAYADDDFASVSAHLVNQDPDPAVAGDVVEVRVMTVDPVRGRIGLSMKGQ